MADELLTIVRQAREGNREAFHQLYRRFSPLVLAVVRKRLGSEAEDVAQEVWVLVSKHLPHYDENKAAFVTWLRMVAARKAVKEAVKIQRRRELLNLLAEHYPIDPGHDSPNPDHKLQQEELVQLIGTLTKHLTAQERRIFHARWFCEMSTAEIADHCEITAGRVRGLLSDSARKISGHLRQLDLL